MGVLARLALPGTVTFLHARKELDVFYLVLLFRDGALWLSCQDLKLSI